MKTRYMKEDEKLAERLFNYWTNMYIKPKAFPYDLNLDFKYHAEYAQDLDLSTNTLQYDFESYILTIEKRNGMPLDLLKSPVRIDLKDLLVFERNQKWNLLI